MLMKDIKCFINHQVKSFYPRIPYGILYNSITATSRNFRHFTSTFMTTGRVTTFPNNCSGPIAIFSTKRWFWIGTLSSPCLYTIDRFRTQTPGVPFAPTTINF